MIAKPFALFSPALLAAASCSAQSNVDSASNGDALSGTMDADEVFVIEERGTYDEPWAAAFVPGTEVLVITTKPGQLIGYDTAADREFTISGAPQVDYGGQGGLGDIAFLQSEAADTLASRTIFLSFAEAGQGDTRGAAVGKGQMVCDDQRSCEIRDFEVIWRQTPKVTGRGHYSHRLLFSPDERYLYVASGDRQKLEPAQDTSNTLGTIVRLNLDGSAAEGNPEVGDDTPSNEIWSYGHRNILGMDWDAQGRLWEVEHGPAGGDELNLVKKGANYGWPTRSNGDHYNGDPITDHNADDGFTKPAVSWSPVIAPGDMLFYRGDLFSAWRGDALMPGLKTQALIRVEIDGENAREAARYEFDDRLRAIAEGPDGALWILEDREGASLLKLTPK